MKGKKRSSKKGEERCTGCVLESLLISLLGSYVCGCYAVLCVACYYSYLFAVSDNVIRLSTIEASRWRRLLKLRQSEGTEREIKEGRSGG